MGCCEGPFSDALAQPGDFLPPRADRRRQGERESPVPPKVRELVAELERAGFVDRGGKGGHRNFVHPKVTRPVTISGNSGDDAKHYQVRTVRLAIEESKK